MSPPTFSFDFFSCSLVLLSPPAFFSCPLISLSSSAFFVLLSCPFSSALFFCFLLLLSSSHLFFCCLSRLSSAVLFCSSLQLFSPTLLFYSFLLLSPSALFFCFLLILCSPALLPCFLLLLRSSVRVLCLQPWFDIEPGRAKLMKSALLYVKAWMLNTLKQATHSNWCTLINIDFHFASTSIKQIRDDQICVEHNLGKHDFCTNAVVCACHRHCQDMISFMIIALALHNVANSYEIETNKT